MDHELDARTLAEVLNAQRNEITEYHIYSHLARKIKDADNSATLQRIADDEKRHAEIWKQYTGKEVRPVRWKVVFYSLVSRLLGLTFGVKLMERGEGGDVLQTSDAEVEHLEAHAPGDRREAVEGLPGADVQLAGAGRSRAAARAEATAHPGPARHRGPLPRARRRSR